VNIKGDIISTGLTWNAERRHSHPALRRHRRA
jgi:hypothetical protein